MPNAGPVIDDLWYKNAIVYCLDVETYVDANGDGVGDFAGLTRRLDYLAGLGVSCLWLQPFYPSPNKDNGYDVSDYYGIHRKHGTLGEFVEFMNHAEQLDAPGVLAMRYEWDDHTLVILHNFTPKPRAVALHQSAVGANTGTGMLVDLLATNDSRVDDNGRYVVQLQPYDHRWFRAGGIDRNVAR
jgi:hypothetical protein